MFTWDIPKAIANYEKHGVPFEEAATVFADLKAVSSSCKPRMVKKVVQRGRS